MPDESANPTSNIPAMSGDGDGSTPPPPPYTEPQPPLPPSASGKRFSGGKGRFFATMFGILLLVGAVGAGIILVQQQQLFRQKASTCEPGQTFCGGGSCPDGWSYGDGCYFGSCDARHNEACSSHQGGGGAPAPAPATGGGGAGCPIGDPNLANWPWNCMDSGQKNQWCQANKGVSYCGAYDRCDDNPSQPCPTTPPTGGTTPTTTGGGCNPGTGAYGYLTQGAQGNVAVSSQAGAGDVALDAETICGATAGCPEGQGKVCIRQPGGSYGYSGPCVRAHACGSTADTLGRGFLGCSTSNQSGGSASSFSPNAAGCWNCYNVGNKLQCDNDPTSCGAKTECRGGATTTATTTTGGGGGTPPTTTTQAPAAQCLNIKAFDTNWKEITNLATLKAGDTVRFTVAGNATSGSFDMARFTINNTLRTAVTGKKPDTSEFFDEYTIPSGITSFTVKAEVHHSSLGWF